MRGDDPVGEAVVEQPADAAQAHPVRRQVGDAHPVVRGLDAEEVELHDTAAPRERDDLPVVEVGAVHMVDDDAGEISARGVEDVQDLVRCLRMASRMHRDRPRRCAVCATAAP